MTNDDMPNTAAATATDKLNEILSLVERNPEWNDRWDELHAELKLALYESALAPSNTGLRFIQVCEAIRSSHDTRDKKQPIKASAPRYFPQSPNTNRFIYDEDTVSGKDCYITSGSLRHELYNKKETMQAIRTLSQQARSVTIISGPRISADDNGQNLTANLVDERIDNLTILYSSERWETHGAFIDGMKCTFETPHTELHTRRRSLEYVSSDPIIALINRDIARLRASGTLNEIQSTSELEKRMLPPGRFERAIEQSFLEGIDHPTYGPVARRNYARALLRKPTN